MSAVPAPRSLLQLGLCMQSQHAVHAQRRMGQTHTLLGPLAAVVQPLRPQSVVWAGPTAMQPRESVLGPYSVDEAFAPWSADGFGAQCGKMLSIRVTRKFCNTDATATRQLPHLSLSSGPRVTKEMRHPARLASSRFVVASRLDDRPGQCRDGHRY